MKYAFLILALFAVLVLNVECTSPMKCPEKCDKSMCRKVECECGKYLDECDCCDYCFKCADEECLILANERCEEGYTCKREEGTSGPDYFNKPGRCTKKE